MKIQSGDREWNISDDERNQLTAWLTINRACNLRCEWCYAKMTDFASEDMSLEIVEKCINIVKGQGVESIILIGGEPTIHPKFFEILDLIKKTGLRAYLVSNAIKFADMSFLEKTIMAGVSSITVSFKAVDRDTFFRDTGKDLFQESITAVKNIVKLDVHHVVNVTACDETLSRLDELIETLKTTGTDKFSIDTGKPVFVDGKSSMEGMGTPTEMAGFFMSNYEKFKASGLRFSVKVAIPFCNFPKKFVDMMIEDGNILTGCQMTSNRGLIFDPSGEWLPCNHLCDISLGKLGKDFLSPEDYWKYRKSSEVKDFYSEMSTYPDNRCEDCEYWPMCGAGCKLYWLHYNADQLIGTFQGEGR